MSTLQRQLQVIMDRLKVLAKNQPRAPPRAYEAYTRG